MCSIVSHLLTTYSTQHFWPSIKETKPAKSRESSQPIYYKTATQICRKKRQTFSFDDFFYLEKPSICILNVLIAPHFPENRSLKN
jgi:hypothetical protein